MPYGDKKSYSFFKMKYQGNNSAFPFKSPLKDHEKDEDGKVIEHKDSEEWELESRTIMANPSDTTSIKSMQTSLKSGGFQGKDKMSSLLDDE
jgi:hypothetical protein